MIWIIIFPSKCTSLLPLRTESTNIPLGKYPKGNLFEFNTVKPEQLNVSWLPEHLHSTPQIPYCSSSRTQDGNFIKPLYLFAFLIPLLNNSCGWHRRLCNYTATPGQSDQSRQISQWQCKCAYRQRGREEGRAKFFLPPINPQLVYSSGWRTRALLGWRANCWLRSQRRKAESVSVTVKLRKPSGELWTDFNQCKSLKTWLMSHMYCSGGCSSRKCQAGAIASRAKQPFPCTKNSQTETFSWDVLSSRGVFTSVKMNALILAGVPSYLREVKA